MFYTIYKITNLINGKYYIGKHQTEDLQDNYMGSGVWIKRAIKKYGKNNFVKELLLVCESKKHMNLAEKILVVSDKEISYNMKNGGNGGFDHINETHLKKSVITKRKKGCYEPQNNPMFGKKHSDISRKNMSLNSLGKGKQPKKEETKRKMSEARKKYWELKRGN